MAHNSDNVLLAEGPSGQLKELVELARSRYSDLDYRKLMGGPTDQEFRDAFERNIKAILDISPGDTKLSGPELNQLRDKISKEADRRRAEADKHGVYGLGSAELSQAVNEIQLALKPPPVREQLLRLIIEEGFIDVEDACGQLRLKEYELAPYVDELRNEGLLNEGSSYLELKEDAVVKLPREPDLWPEPTSLYAYSQLAWAGEMAASYPSFESWDPGGEAPLMEMLKSKKLTGKQGFALYTFECRHNRAASRLLRAIHQLFPELKLRLVAIPEGSGTIWAGEYNPNYLDDGWPPESKGWHTFQAGYIPVKWFLDLYKKHEGDKQGESFAVNVGKLLKRAGRWGRMKDELVDGDYYIAPSEEANRHYLSLTAPERPWKKAFTGGRERLAALSEEQMMEAENLARLNEGVAVMLEEPSGLRKKFEGYLDELETLVADPEISENLDDEAGVVWKALPGRWGELHREAFCLGACGVLCATGLKTYGTNMPGWPQDMAMDYWPERGLLNMGLSRVPYKLRQYDREAKFSFNDLRVPARLGLRREIWPDGGHPPDAL